MDGLFLPTRGIKKMEFTEMMNHRLGERLRVDLPAVVHPLDRAPVRVWLVDASLSGLGVRVPNDQHFHLMEPVEVSFFLPCRDGDWEPMDLRAFMVREADGMLGLMLAMESPELMWRLRTLSNARFSPVPQEGLEGPALYSD